MTSEDGRLIFPAVLGDLHRPIIGIIVEDKNSGQGKG
jgi:hypothetical protein